MMGMARLDCICLVCGNRSAASLVGLTSVKKLKPSNQTSLTNEYQLGFQLRAANHFKLVFAGYFSRDAV